MVDSRIEVAMMRYCPIALVVSGNHQLRRLIAGGLDDLGCTTIEAASEEEGLDHAEFTRVDVVVVDVCDRDGFESSMVRNLRTKQPDLKVLYLVGRASPMLKARIHASCLRKPFHLYELCDIVSSWLEHHVALLTVSGISLN